MSFIIDGTNGLTFNDSSTQKSAAKVLQVAQATFTGTQTIATGGVNANWTDISSLSVTITPFNSSSKFLLFAQITATIDLDRLAYLNLREAILQAM